MNHETHLDSNTPGNPPANHSDPSEPQSRSRFAKPAYVPLVLAALFMTVGISFLVFLGREETRLRGVPFGDVDLMPLLFTEDSLDENDLKGKIVVLHFWGFWSDACSKDYPGIAALQKEYIDSKDVLFVSIASDSTSPEKEDDLAFYTKKFINTFKIAEMPVYWDPVEYTRKQVSQLFSSGGLTYPTTIVLDQESKIVQAWRSPVAPAKLKATIERSRSKK